MSDQVKPPVWYWIVSVIAVLWNAMGVMQYLGTVYMTDEAMKELPEYQQEYLSNVPSFVMGAFALAVFCGIIGSILMLLRKAAAQILFIISFIAVLVQSSYNLAFANVKMEIGDIILIVTVVAFALALVVFSRGSKNRGWI